jgi:hypothetical protein
MDASLLLILLCLFIVRMSFKLLVRDTSKLLTLAHGEALITVRE